MSTIYLLLLCGVCVVVLAVIGEGVLSVSRRPAWSTPQRKPELVKTVDRRVRGLPFVGQDRRDPASRSPGVAAISGFADLADQQNRARA